MRNRNFYQNVSGNRKGKGIKITEDEWIDFPQQSLVVGSQETNYITSVTGEKALII
jgi:hypothetical protein